MGTDSRLCSEQKKFSRLVLGRLELLTLKSPLRNTGVSGCFSRSSSIQTVRAERSSINSLSSPDVGMYIDIWMVFGRLGGLKIRGRNDGDVAG